MLPHLSVSHICTDKRRYKKHAWRKIKTLRTRKAIHQVIILYVKRKERQRIPFPTKPLLLNTETEPTARKQLVALQNFWLWQTPGGSNTAFGSKQNLVALKGTFGSKENLLPHHMALPNQWQFPKYTSSWLLGTTGGWQKTPRLFHRWFSSME